METLVASVVRQLRVTWSPAEIALGVALIFAVGAGAVAAGAVSAGGGGGCFFATRNCDQRDKQHYRNDKAKALIQGVLLPKAKV